jgi:hypothetical protein
MKTLALVILLTGISTSLLAQSLSSYQTTVTGQSPTAYFKLDGTLNDAITPSQLLTASGGYFGVDAARQASKAYVFNAQADALTLAADIIPGGDVATNAAATGKGSISVLFRTLVGTTNTGQRFVFCQGNVTSNGNALALYFENSTSTNGGAGDLKLRVGNSTTSILASNQIVGDSWHYFAMTYDESRDAGEVIWYVGRAGGALTSGTMDIGNDAVVGDNGTVAIGNQPDLSSGYRNPGNGRIDEFAVWNRELSAAEVAAQFAQLPNYLPANASYANLVTTQVPAHFFTLDNSLADSVAGQPALQAGGATGAFVPDLFGNANSAYAFNETNDLLFATNDIVNGGGPAGDTTSKAAGTISLLFRTLTDTNNGGQRYIFSQGTNSTTRDQLGLFFENNNIANGDPNSLKLRVGNGPTTTILFPQNILTNTWYYFAMIYDENRDSTGGGEVRFFLGPVGGTLGAGAINIANDSVVGDNGTFYLGNRITLRDAFRNPGSGAVDALATWNDELSPAEINAQFNAAAGPPPSLEIHLDGGKAVVGWTTNFTSAFHLESSPSVAPTAWSVAGLPTNIVNGEYMVTNDVAGAQFFRLTKP